MKAMAVYRKELRQISRDRRTLTTIIFVPAFFLLLYGYALNWDIRHITLAVQDRDATPQSRALIAAFVNSGYFDRVEDAWSPAEIDRLLDGFPEVEKTSLFGTAVHAVLRDARTTPEQLAAKLQSAGVQAERIAAVAPSLEDVFLDVIDRVEAAAGRVS